MSGTDRFIEAVLADAAGGARDGAETMTEQTIITAAESAYQERDAQLRLLDLERLIE